MKKIISLVCTVLLLFSVGATGFAAPVRADAQSVPIQINLIYSNFRSFQQQDDGTVWSYTVTDLDHNGRLELLAASMRGSGHYTDLKAWEVGEDRNSFVACNIHVPEGDSFPDMIANEADTYYVSASDLWNYAFDDNITVAPYTVQTIRSVVFMQSSNLGYSSFATRQTDYAGSNGTITYTDRNGSPITEADYQSSVDNAFPGAQKSTVRFDWFTASEASSTARFSDSYAVFAGEAKPDVAPSVRSMSGVVTDASGSSVMISLSNSRQVQVSGGICSVINGTAVPGCSCTVYYNGSVPASGNIYHVDIYGVLTGYTVDSYHYYCPACNWEVSADAAYCPHCGYLFVTPPAYHVYCINCGNEVSSDDDFCPYCGYIFATGGYITDGVVYYNGLLVPDDAGVTAYCPSCNSVVDMDDDFCPYCGYVFATGDYITDGGTGYLSYGVPITDGSGYTAYCPNCNHSVPEDTDVCPYCGYIFETGGFLEDGTAYNTYGTEVTDGSDYYEAYCPNCNHAVSADTDVCPYCGYIFEIGGFLEDGTAYNTYGTEVTDGSDYYESYDYDYSDSSSYDYEEQEQYKTCADCGAQVPVSYTNCPNCGGYDFIW